VNGQTTDEIQKYYPCAKDSFPKKSNKPPVSFSCPQPIRDPMSALSDGICFCLPSDHFSKVPPQPLEHTERSRHHSRNQTTSKSSKYLRHFLQWFKGNTMNCHTCERGWKVRTETAVKSLQTPTESSTTYL